MLELDTVQRLIFVIGHKNNMINTVHLWDCLEIMKSIPDGSIDAIITDPPYWSTACRWDQVIPFDLMWKELKRIIKPNGAIVLFGSEPFSSALRMSNIKQYKYDWVYVKSQAQNFLNSKKQPLRNNECISIFYKNQCTYNPQMEKWKPYICKRGKSSKSISNDENITNWGYITENNWTRYPLQVMNKFNIENWLHPTQKPVALIEYLIRTYTNEWETVLDFTAWSWTTWVACQNTNRNYILIEKDEWYYEISKERLLKNKILLWSI